MPMSSNEALVIQSMAADRATGELARAFREAGVKWLLLKGPSVRSLLYPDTASRPYVDVDVLVAPGDLPTAEALLQALGYEPAPYSTRQEVEHDSPWRRPGGSTVDLHRGFTHVPAPGSATWTALSRDTRQIEVAGEAIQAASEGPMALLIALHALGDAPAKGKAFGDLERACESFELDVWNDAREIAYELRAERNLAVALALTPKGKPIATRMGLPQLSRWEARFRTGSRAAMAALVDRILRERGAKGLFTGLAQELRRDRPTNSFRDGRVGAEGRSGRNVWRMRRIARGSVKVPVAMVSWAVQRKDFRD
jgi:hypothetical protein